MERTAVDGKRVPKPMKRWSPSPTQKKKKISKRAATRSVSGRRGERSRSGRGRADEQQVQVVTPVRTPVQPRGRNAERSNVNHKRVLPSIACSARGANRKRAGSPPSGAAKRAPARRQSPPVEEESEESDRDSEEEMEEEEEVEQVEPQPKVPSLMPRAESPKENPEAPSSGETSEAESEEGDDDKDQTDSQMKENEEDEECDTSSGAETEESSSKKVSPDRPCTSSQNAPGADESRSPSAESEQTTTTPELNSSNSTTSSRQSENPDAMEQKEEVDVPPSTPRQPRRLDKLTQLNPATSSSSSRAVSEELEVESTNAPRAEENKENVVAAENSEAMEQEEEVDMPPAHRPSIRLEDVSSTSTQNAQRAENTSGVENEEPSVTTPSTPIRCHESSEAMEQEEEVAIPPPVISSPPPTRRLTRLLAKSNPVEPVPRAVSKEPLSSSKKQTRDVPSTSSQLDSDRPSTSSSKNALRAQQQVEKENVPTTTSSEVTANLSKLACCPTDDATTLPYHAGNLRCVNNPDCRIPPDAEFWELEDSVTETFYCLKCFDEKKPKGKFEKKKNDNDEVEPILECQKCRGSFHQCCSFYYEEDLSKFICEVCTGVRVKKTIDGVEKSPLAAYMTKKMLNFLASRLGGVVEHPIRICGYSEAKSAKSSTVVPPILRQQFVKKHSKTMNYVSRALHVYQRIDDVDVITFAIYTAEYEFRGGEEKWSLIDYIDSLPYFKKFDGVQKKEIHHMLIHTYYEYMGGLGFRSAHLWSNPPQKGDDYVFNIHPFDQPFLNPTGLIGWYQSLLRAGQEKKILAGFSDFQGARSRFAKPIDIPVFVGSIWSTVFQEAKKTTSMKVFESELEEKKAKHGDDNFFIEIAAPTTRQPQETAHHTHEILGDRVKLLEMCVEKNWQFENLRRAKYSSVALIRMMEEQE
ncbi:hypothetical protein GCK72_004005 [Caenorhabditis remanei]|uniref:histone acetyltransferase n=1 Tax=Caenorhabditis remanei TaxID=31234 RepID=A0A6A5HAH6_CAERE|nr:hypothetical protein GCK72_004005 [Caenorhabditis remanei]KAF1764059.1 hypothetical protein GCK72_004005 [Caenorhabditis remanei]